MNKKGKIFIIFWVFTTVLLYVLVLGNAGFLIRKELEKEKFQLSLQIEDLKQENRILNDTYVHLVSEESRNEQERSRSGSTILKFEDLPESEPSALTTGLEEWRALYWVSAVLIGLLGMILSGRGVKKEYYEQEIRTGRSGPDTVGH